MCVCARQLACVRHGNLELQVQVGYGSWQSHQPKAYIGRTLRAGDSNHRYPVFIIYAKQLEKGAPESNISDNHPTATQQSRNGVCVRETRVTLS